MSENCRIVRRESILRAAQLEVLDAVSDAFEVVAVEGGEKLRDEMIYEANRRLKEDGHPFEFWILGWQIFVRELK